MKDRIKQIMAYDGLNAAQFSTKVNINASALSHLLSGRNFPSYEALQKMLNCYPMINSEWLMRGEGDMLKNGEKFEPAADPSSTEASLFDENPVNQPVHGQTSEYAQEKALNRSKDSAKSINIQMDKSSKNEPVRIKKVVVFYDDNTYEEFISSFVGKH